MKLETDICVESINDDVAMRHDDAITEEHLKYPFVDALKLNVDDRADLPPDSRADMCIYRINRNKSSIPFLEFLLYLDGSATDKGGNKLTFPHILSKHTKTGLVEQCTAPLRALFGGDGIGELDRVIKYSGYIYNKREKRCTLFFNKFHDENEVARTPFMSSKTRWWWTLSSEIFNEHRMMNYRIADSVIAFFNRHPKAMHLTAHGRTLESPSACYAGKHLNYISYMAAFGMKKASTRAHFGPYYYSGDFMGTMRYACYAMGFEEHVLANGTVLTMNKHGKHTNGGIARFAVFLGRCRAFFLNGDEDRSELSMYWANKDPMIKAKLALRDINGDWTRDFNSAYVGEYSFNVNDTTKKRVPGWTIKEYDNQIPLSCHEIDTKNVPDEYDPDFTNYHVI
jgi:hypothetical protein